MSARPRERRPGRASFALVPLLALTLAARAAVAGGPSFPVVGSVAIVAPGPPDAVERRAARGLVEEVKARATSVSRRP